MKISLLVKENEEWEFNQTSIMLSLSTVKIGVLIS